MEFDSSLTKIQGILLSQEKSLGSLKDLKFGDEKIVTIVEAIKQASDQICEKASSSQNANNIKRKIHLYLVLNTEFINQEKFYDNDNISHLLNTAPQLSKDLLASIVIGCGLSSLGGEVITYCEPSLSIEYLEMLTQFTKQLPTIDYFDEIFKYITALFLRLVRICKGIEKCDPSNKINILNKFYKSYIDLLSNISNQLIIKLKDEASETILTCSGYVTKRVISLVIDCMYYIQNPTPLDWYPESVITYSYDQWEENDIDDINIQMCMDIAIDVCMEQMKNVRINTWLAWENVTGVQEGRTIQAEIAEEAYMCINIKTEYESANFTKLKAKLMDFQSKPQDETDEIKIADLPTTIACISDKKKSQRLWLEALLCRKDLCSTIEALDALKININLLNTDMTFKLMCLVMKAKCADENMLKEIAFQAFQNTPVIDQAKLIEDFFTQFKLNDKFKTSNFDSTITSVLNRSSNLQTRREKWLPEMFSLCLQSPLELVQRIILAGVTSRGQGSVMCAALAELKALCNLEVRVETEERNSKLLLHVLSETMATIEPATSQIIHLVLLLEENGMVKKEEFLHACLMPALKRDLTDYKVPHIQHWLQLLRKLLKVDSPQFLQLEPGVSLAVILAVLAEVLQRASWVLGKFRQQESLLRADTVLLVRPLACRMANTSEPEDKDLLWIRSGLLKLTSHNRSHFSPLWTHFGMPVPSMNLGALLLSRDAMCQQTNMPPGGPDQLLSPLLILLPTCCTPEWRLLASTLSALQAYHSNANTAEVDDEEETQGHSEEQMLPDVLRLLVTTLMLQALMLSQPQPDDHAFSNDCALACLENSVRNLGIVMKEEWLPRLCGIESVEAGAGVVRQVALLLRSLPAALAGSCSLALSGVLVQAQEVLLVQAAPRPELATWCAHELALSLALLPDRESRQALSRKLLIEPALAQL